MLVLVVGARALVLAVAFVCVCLRFGVRFVPNMVAPPSPDAGAVRAAPMLAFGFTGDRASMYWVSNLEVAVVVGRLIKLVCVESQSGAHAGHPGHMKLSNPPPTVAEVVSVNGRRQRNVLLALEINTEGNYQIAVMNLTDLERTATVSVKQGVPITSVCPSNTGDYLFATLGDRDGNDVGELLAWSSGRSLRPCGQLNIKNGTPLKVTANPYDMNEFALHGKSFFKKVTLDEEKGTFRETPLTGIKHISRKDMVIVDHAWLKTGSEMQSIGIATEKNGVLILTNDAVTTVVPPPDHHPIYCLSPLKEGILVGGSHGKLFHYSQTIAYPIAEERTQTNRKQVVTMQLRGTYISRPDEIQPILCVDVKPDDNGAAVYVKDVSVKYFSIAKMQRDQDMKANEENAQPESASTERARRSKKWSLFSPLLPGFSRKPLIAMSCAQSRPLLAVAHESDLYMTEDEVEAADANISAAVTAIRAERSVGALIRVFNWMSYKVENEIYVLDMPTTILMHPNGWYLYVAFPYNISVYVLGANSKPTLKDDWHFKKCNVMSIDPKGARMAVAEGAEVSIVDPLSGNELAKLVGHQGHILAMEWCNAGLHLMTSDSTGTTYTWNVAGNFRRAEEYVRKGGSCVSLAITLDRARCFYADPTFGIGWFGTLDNDPKGRALMSAKWAAAMQGASGRKLAQSNANWT